MKKKKIIAVFFLFTVFLFFLLNIIISQKCQNIKILTNLYKFSPNIVEECFNSVDTKNNIKNLLKNNKILYNFAAKIKVKFFKEFGKSREIYENLNLNDKKYVEFDKVDNIKGNINNELFLKKFSISKFNNEINNKTWARSHGNNWNTKFYDAKIINKNNAKNLKLAWSYNPIDNLNIEDNWKNRIGINPVYAEGIVYFVSANWELNAVNAENGKLIWSLKFPYEVGKRGILWHKNSSINESFIFINAGEKLYKIKSKTGKLEKNFGK